MNAAEIVILMNTLYTSALKLFLNFVFHTVKMMEKKRVASKTVTRYDRFKQNDGGLYVLQCHFKKKHREPYEI